MEFIERVLHITVREVKPEKPISLPRFLTSRYCIKMFRFDKQKVFVLEAKVELDKVNMIKNHIHRVQELENIPVVIMTERMTSRQKESFIKAGIPFIVQNKQIYLPFMGILLSNRNDTVVEKIEKLLPSTQAILFYIAEQNMEKVYVSDIVKKLGFSGMTISRGVRQLEQLDIIQTYKDKVQKVIVSKKRGRELLIESEPYLINPVKAEGYISRNLINESFYKAGDVALSHYSMLNPPKISCYAVMNDIKWRQYLKSELFDEQLEVKVQLWKYDPAILTTTDVVDRLSLALSYKDEKDERVCEAIEEMLEERIYG